MIKLIYVNLFYQICVYKFIKKVSNVNKKVLIKDVICKVHKELLKEYFNMLKIKKKTKKSQLKQEFILN